MSIYKSIKLISRTKYLIIINNVSNTLLTIINASICPSKDILLSIFNVCISTTSTISVIFLY